MASEAENKAAVKRNCDLGWCLCGEERDYECECFSLNRLALFQGKAAPSIVRTKDAVEEPHTDE